MTSVPRPKPWETNAFTDNTKTTNNNAEASSSKLTSSFDNAALVATTSSSSAPKVPDRPTGIADNALTTTGEF